MTREILNQIENDYWEEKASPIDMTEVFDLANKALEQEPKTGYWREDIDNNRRWDRVRFYCSECGDWQTYGKSDYCPNCGCRMFEPQESEG